LGVPEEKQLLVLLENMPNVAVEGYDLDGRVVLWNRAAERVFGFTVVEAVGRTLDQLILTKQAAREFVELLRGAQASGSGVGPMQWDFRRRDGSIGTVMSTIVPFPFPDGSPRFLCIDVDVTEQHRMEQALREKEQRFRTLAENSLVGLWHITPGGYTIYINPALLRMLEVDAAEAMEGHTYRDFFTEESNVRIEAELRSRARGVASNYEVEMVGLRGTHRNVIISGAPLLGDDGKLQSVIGTFTDITPRKQAEQQLNELLKKQRATLNELDHRVRNNLASLLTLIDVSAKDTADVATFAGAIRGRVRAMSLVHNMLSQSQWVALRMHKILEMLVPDELREAVALQGPELVVMPRQCTPLAMALQEFVSNSLKYGALSVPAGRVTVSWEIDRDASAREQSIELRWVERGGPPVREPTSLGSGLELVRGLVEGDLRGVLGLSFPVEGATHILRFPLDHPNHANQKAEKGT